MRNLAPVLGLSLALLACDGAKPAATVIAEALPNVVVTGTVVERLDERPYSYLKVQTGVGTSAWIAVPASSIDIGSKVTVENGVAVNNVEVRTVGRRFDSVVFGTLRRK